MADAPFRNPAELKKIKAVAGTDADGPIVMLNLNRYKDAAGFPDGALYRRYREALDALLPEVGGKILCGSIEPECDALLMTAENAEKRGIEPLALGDVIVGVVEAVLEKLAGRDRHHDVVRPRFGQGPETAFGRAGSVTGARDTLWRKSFLEHPCVR